MDKEMEEKREQIGQYQKEHEDLTVQARESKTSGRGGKSSSGCGREAYAVRSAGRRAETDHYPDAE